MNATTGAYAFGTLAASSFATGSLPSQVAVNPAANLLYVSNSGTSAVPNEPKVTFFNATTGAYAFGTFEASSFVKDSVLVGEVAVNPTANLIYIVDISRSCVLFLNATTGAYVF